MTYDTINDSIQEENIRFYKDYGFLIANEIFSEDDVNTLNQEVIGIASGKKGAVEGILEDAENIPENELIKRYTAIHFPHKLSPLIKEYARHSYITDILSKLISPNVKCLQSMFFIKAPGKKGQSWHQDEYFIPTRDRSLTGAWIALDDADVSNGCLWVIPGSHQEGVIRKRIDNNDANFADLEVADLKPYTEKDFLKVEVKKGSVIFFNGYLLHMSLQNNSSDRYRRALVCHYSSAESMLPWNLDGRVDFTDDFRDIFIVAGKDPYGHKGILDLAKPFIRPDVLDFSSGSQESK
ncbi:MAG: phytanoyl-CoA dioxygenase family protein [Cyclobacteriaceae bacterium]|nr:phytanoyl-CoA dioxygenase family protein [Cyclobacteriaceae bacterium HetDA_MAG_MS6]